MESILLPYIYLTGLKHKLVHLHPLKYMSISAYIIFLQRSMIKKDLLLCQILCTKEDIVFNWITFDTLTLSDGYIARFRH